MTGQIPASEQRAQDFARAALWIYLETAAWADGEEAGAHCRDDFDRKAVNSARSDLAGFFEYVAETCPDAADELDAYHNRAGHDFWLSRNGHGAGFWDGDWEHGRVLRDAAKTFGTVDIVEGDNGPTFA
jgi:hypothetical protein